jgi:hypothetical protein
MTHYVLLSVNHESYTTRSGEEVNKINIFYFDPSVSANSRLEKGFTILTKNVYPDFNLSDFSEIPAVYDLTFRPSRGRRGALEPRLVSVDYIEPYNISGDSQDLLVLGAKKYDYSPDAKTQYRGVKIFAIDPQGFVSEDGGLMGYPLLEASLQKESLENFPTVPAYYSIDLEQIRGKGGDSLFKAKKIAFASRFDNNQTYTTQSL